MSCLKSIMAMSFPGMAFYVFSSCGKLSFHNCSLEKTRPKGNGNVGFNKMIMLKYSIEVPVKFYGLTMSEN